MNFEKLKKEIILNRFGIDDNKVLKLKEYWDILLFFEDTIHLFSKKRQKEELNRQFYDIILLNVFLPDYKKLIDAGAGAGFVGIILSILNPEKSFFLVERSKKKTDFLELASIRLNLTNVNIFQKDMKDFVFNADVVVSKASCMRRLLESKLEHLVRVGGILVHFTNAPLPAPYKNYPFKNTFRDNISYLSVLERVV